MLGRPWLPAQVDPGQVSFSYFPAETDAISVTRILFASVTGILVSSKTLVVKPLKPFTT